MTLKTDAVGKTYPPVHYAVGREKVREFASRTLTREVTQEISPDLVANA